MTGPEMLLNTLLKTIGFEPEQFKTMVFGIKGTIERLDANLGEIKKLCEDNARTLASIEQMFGQNRPQEPPHELHRLPGDIDTSGALNGASVLARPHAGE